MAPSRGRPRGRACTGTPVCSATAAANAADPTVRANLRKELRFVDDETLHEYLDVTPRTWGERFHDQDWVNPAVLALLTPSSL